MSVATQIAANPHPETPEQITQVLYSAHQALSSHGLKGDNFALEVMATLYASAYGLYVEYTAQNIEWL